MKKIGIIHTTKATVESLGNLVEQLIPGVQVVNLLDDSILGDMRDGNNIEYVRERWLSYAWTLERMDVKAILSACSTVGAFAEEADRLLAVPVYRIDEAMAEEAVKRGKKIAVFATLQSTLEPTVRLVERKAAQQKKEIFVETVLVEGAYQALMRNEKSEHDKMIADAVEKRLEEADILLLAQASMASAVSSLEGAEGKILTSPELGIRKLKRDLEVSE